MSGAVRSYHDLIAWQKAMTLVSLCYRLSRRFPADELYGLTSQLRRAAVSVPASIAEGQGRSSSAEFARHLSIAYGSLMEIETHLLIASDPEYLAQEECDQALRAAAEVGKLSNALKRSLPSRPAGPRRLS